MRSIHALPRSGGTVALGLVLLVGAAGCGGETTEQVAADEPTAAVDDAPADAASDDPAPEAETEASGVPSEPYAPLDDLELPAAGAGVLVIGGETVPLTGVSCPSLEQTTAQLEQGQFRFHGEGQGTLPDGREVNVAAQRGVGDPERSDYDEHDVYELDQVTLEVRDERGAALEDSTMVRAVRPLVGGPDRYPFGDGDGLPMVKIRDDAGALTASGTAATTAGDDTGPLGGPFTLVMHCGA